MTLNEVSCICKSDELVKTLPINVQEDGGRTHNRKYQRAYLINSAAVLRRTPVGPYATYPKFPFETMGCRN